MARFRLLASHYLNCPGTEWEQIEANVQGKQVRHRYKVHRLLDPANAEDYTNKVGGQGGSEIVVSTKEDPQYPQDIVFIGPPTQDMEPLDEEARSILANTKFGVQPMSEAAFPTGIPVVQAPVSGPDPLAEMRKMMAELQGQVTMLVGENEALRRKTAEAAALAEEVLATSPPPPPKPGIQLGA